MLKPDYIIGKMDSGQPKIIREIFKCHPGLMLSCFLFESKNK